VQNCVVVVSAASLRSSAAAEKKQSLVSLPHAARSAETTNKMMPHFSSSPLHLLQLLLLLVSLLLSAHAQKSCNFNSYKPLLPYPANLPAILPDSPSHRVVPFSLPHRSLSMYSLFLAHTRRECCIVCGVFVFVSSSFSLRWWNLS
jgi:hypothetical protein